MELQIDVKLVGTTCQVMDETVNLPSIAQRNFTGVGATVGETPFRLNVQNCPQGFDRVNYSMSPVGGTGQNGELPLGAGSTGEGAVVRLTDLQSHPVTFDQPSPVPGYVKEIGGSYQIPMIASYFQTEPVVKPGTINGAITVNLDYR